MPMLPTSLTVETTFYHFCPQFTPKPFIVNKKVIGYHCETKTKGETARFCGLEKIGPQYLGFRQMVRNV